ncbi:MAG: Cof-type HAD-IIB family hydrolase [Prevotellaceae bacterium]|jgi:Cof subfamily protein (haloacid dehalogenase superfamily)|nr:Cof-type HAD-IIB family hydrolase [Prevotellaceae bacterium]
MIKALFFDIDGTLVSFDTHVVPPSAVDAIRAAHEAGVRIFIATGRPAVIINNIAPLQQAGLISGYVTMNGAYCFVDDTVIYKSPIPPADVHALARASQDEGFPCIFVGEHDISVCQPDDEVVDIFHDILKVDDIPLATPDEVVRRDIYQMSPFIGLQREADLMPALPGSESNRWHPVFTDITARGNNKQHGISRIIEHFGIRRDEIMALGDGGNDIGMLRYAHIGIAMGNARDEVKAVADYVTTDVDRAGVEHALHHFGIV